MNFFKTTLSVVAAFAIGAGTMQAQGTSTVYDTIASNTDLTNLTLALDTTGLDEALGGDGPFTVFAPSDGAFGTIPADTLSKLLGDSDALSNILTYHVVPGIVTSDLLVDGDFLITLQGDSLEVSVEEVDGATVFKVDTATIDQADIVASNGVVHKINSILMPSVDTISSVKTLKSADVNLRVFPNPTVDIATIEVPSDVRISSIEVLNQAGQVVAKQTASDRIDLSAQPVGTYYLFIETNKGLVSQTLQKAGQ